MRLFSGGAVLLTVLATTTTTANAHQDLDEPSPSSSLLRGTANLQQARAQLTFPIYEPLQDDFARTNPGNEEDLRRLMDTEGHSNHTGMFHPLSCNADVTVDTCLGPDAVPFSTIVAAADHPSTAVATQSSTCYDSPASNAINGDHFDFSHTCSRDTPAWWMVDFGDDIAVEEGMFIKYLWHF